MHAARFRAAFAISNKAAKMKISNFYQLTPSIGTAGYPKPEDFSRIAAEGYRVVINLAMHDAPDAVDEEGALVSKEGMVYVHIPVPFDNPTAEHFRIFKECMDAFADKKVFVHCQLNLRVAAFMLKYLTAKGVSEEDATTPAMTKWKPSMDDAWKAFLKD